jgi:hypothetical protein
MAFHEEEVEEKVVPVPAFSLCKNCNNNYIEEIYISHTCGVGGRPSCFYGPPLPPECDGCREPQDSKTPEEPGVGPNSPASTVNSQENADVIVVVVN